MEREDKRMLYNMIMEGFGNQEDYNCAEKILYGANIAYKLNIVDTKMAAGFGGGMFVGDKCGAVVGGIMALSQLLTNNVGHQSPELKEAVIEFQEMYEKKMGSSQCKPLKEEFRTEAEGCLSVIGAAAMVLDELIEKKGYIK